MISLQCQHLCWVLIFAIIPTRAFQDQFGLAELVILQSPNYSISIKLPMYNYFIGALLVKPQSEYLYLLWIMIFDI